MWAWVSMALAAQVQLQVERKDLVEGQALPLQLVVSDANVSSVPVIPVPDGLQIEYQGQSTQSFFSNFRSSVALIFNYNLLALRGGSYTIGPLTIQTSAGPLSTAPLRLQVSGRENQGGLDQVTATLGDTVAWAGQLLVYHATFVTGRSLIHAEWAPPQVTGFSLEGAVPAKTADGNLVQEGKSLKQVELFVPMRAGTAGKRTIPGAVLQGQFALARSRSRPQFFGLDRFGDVQEEVFSADPLSVEVKALPTEGRPPDWNGLIGHFQVESHASVSNVKVGDTVTVEITVTGDAPLAGFKLPPLSGDGFRVYDDQPVVTAELEGAKVVANATYKRAVVPQKPGSLDIPGTSVSYFDPTTGRYATAQTEALHLTVTGEAASAQVASFAGTAARPVDTLGEDILPLHTQPNLRASWRGTWAWTLALPGALLLLGEAASRIQPRRRVVEEAYRPDFSALPHEPEARLAALDEMFRRVVSKKLQIKPEQLTRESLTGLGEAAEEAEAVYRQLEAARYRGDAPEALEGRLRSLVEALR